jgi:hypothetical protein
MMGLSLQVAMLGSYNPGSGLKEVLPADGCFPSLVKYVVVLHGTVKEEAEHLLS